MPMYETILNLDARTGKSLYEQIYEYLKGEIQRGNIRCGERLPSTRLLSRQLDVSRSTAQMAYDQLLAEGYIEAVSRRGYFVCRMEELYHLEQEEAEPEEWEECPEKELMIDFAPKGMIWTVSLMPHGES